MGQARRGKRARQDGDAAFEREVDRALKGISAEYLKLRRLDEKDAEFARRVGITPQRLQSYKDGTDVTLDALVRAALSTGQPMVRFFPGEGADFAAGVRYALANIGEALHRLGQEYGDGKLPEMPAALFRRWADEARRTGT